jgi:uncharacterized protein
MAPTSPGQRVYRRSLRPQISFVGFLLLVFGVSWLGTLPMLIDSWQPGQLPAGVAALQLLLFFGTALTTFAVVWWNEGVAGISALLRRIRMQHVGLRWVGFALLAPAVLFWISLQISTWLGYAAMPLGAPGELIVQFGIIFTGYLLLNTEEIAWRGYALPRLVRRYGQWRASMILGGILSLFHIPLFLLQGGHPAGYPFPVFVMMILALTVVFTWLAEHTGGSLLLAHLLHQSFNAWAETIPFFPSFTGSSGPMLVTVGLLTLSALAIGLRWAHTTTQPVASVSHRHE